MMSAQAQFYPWHDKQKHQLMQLRTAEKLPHALLLSGPAWLGKQDFALATAAMLLCETPRDGMPCGDCPGCHLMAAGTHSDFRLIEPEDSRLIKIEQVRDLIEWVNQTPQRGGYKVVVVHPAESMNVNSANAMLKCLEEPTDRTLIMLVSDLPGRLLPTIR
ncbi:MAG TPA: DNA polymerase III subunit, partial [Pseudomonadales bacterium]|nr:DNA polymerase III subunit [Pseudomonadales bacterium]